MSDELPPTYCMTDAGITLRPEARAAMQALGISEASLALWEGPGWGMLARVPAPDEAPDGAPLSPSNGKGNGHDRTDALGEPPADRALDSTTEDHPNEVTETAHAGNGASKERWLKLPSGKRILASSLILNDPENNIFLDPDRERMFRRKITIGPDGKKQTEWRLIRLMTGVAVLHEIIRPIGRGMREPDGNEAIFRISISDRPEVGIQDIGGNALHDGSCWRDHWPGLGLSRRADFNFLERQIQLQERAFGVPNRAWPRHTGFIQAPTGEWSFVLPDGMQVSEQGAREGRIVGYEFNRAREWRNFSLPPARPSPGDISATLRELVTEIDLKGRALPLIGFNFRGTVGSIEAVRTASLSVGPQRSGKSTDCNFGRGVAGPCEPGEPRGGKADATFADTITRIELKLNALRDGPFLLDDARSRIGGSAYETARTTEIAERLITAAAQDEPIRDRSNASLGQPPGVMVKGGLMVTAEESLVGKLDDSRLLRVILLRYAAGEIDHERLRQRWAPLQSPIIGGGHAARLAVLRALSDMPQADLADRFAEADQVFENWIRPNVVQAMPAAPHEYIASLAMRWARAFTGMLLWDRACGCSDYEACNALNGVALPLIVTQLEFILNGGGSGIDREFISGAIRWAFAHGAYLLGPDGRPATEMAERERPGNILSRGYGWREGAPTLTGSRLIGRYDAEKGGGGEYLIAEVLFDYARDYARHLGRELPYTPQTFPAAVVQAGLAQRRGDRNAPRVRIGADLHHALHVYTLETAGTAGTETENDSNINVLPCSRLPDLGGVLREVAGTGFHKQNQRVTKFVPAVPAVLGGNPPLNLGDEGGYTPSAELSGEVAAGAKPAENLGFSAVPTEDEGYTHVGVGDGYTLPAVPSGNGGYTRLGDRFGYTPGYTRMGCGDEHPPGCTPAELRSLIARSGFSGKQLAAALGVAQPQVVKWVRGVRPIPEHHAARIIQLTAWAEDQAARASDVATSAAPEPAARPNGTGHAAAAPAERPAVNAAPEPAVRPNGANPAAAARAKQSALSAPPEPARRPNGGESAPGRPNSDPTASAAPEPAARPNGEGSPAVQPAAQPGKKEDTRPIGALGPDGLWIMSTDGSIECQPLGKKWRPKSALLGELTALAVLKNLRQLWVSAPWAAKAGLPNNLSDEAVREGIRHRFASFIDAPAGWKPDQPGRIKPWLNVRSESSEIVIVMPTLAPDLAFGGATNAETMLRAIGRYRALLKFNFLVNPSVVFSNMMTKTHKGPGTLDLSASMASKEFPEVFYTDGPITRDVWARPLTKEELSSGRYVHIFDKNGMYLAAMSSLAVGFGIPEHITRPIEFRKRADGRKGMVGYFKTRITPPPSWPVLLPHPGFIRASDGDFQWQVHPTLVLAQEHNCTIDIVEAWIFLESHQPFKPVYERLRDARDAVTPATDEVDQVASVAIKQTYTHPIGNLANTRYRDSEEKRDLQRPDWRHCIRSQARANELRNLVKFNLNPFGIRTDAIYLVSATADPMEAAGDLPIGTTLRDWKHLKTFPLSALPREFFDGTAANKPQYYLDAIKKIQV